MLFITFGGFLFLGCEQGLLFGFPVSTLGLGHDGTPGPDWACMAGVETVLWGVGILHSPPTSMQPEYRPVTWENLFLFIGAYQVGAFTYCRHPQLACFALSYKRLEDV
jgi:hypothetical protein